MNCNICLKPILGRKLNNSCESCYKKSRRAALYIPKSKEIKCPICDMSFTALGTQSSQKKYCSTDCKITYKQQYSKSNSVKSYKKEWANLNKEKTRQASKRAYLKTKDIIPLKIKRTLLSNLRFKSKNGKPHTSKFALKFLGLSIDDFCIYLESKFESWMTWDNYGKYDKDKSTWHIDHIRPLCSFDSIDEEQLKIACHYTNLQPLLARENLSKGGKYVAQ
jgi:hypothetical protein